MPGTRPGCRNLSSLGAPLIPLRMPTQEPPRLDSCLLIRPLPRETRFSEHPTSRPIGPKVSNARIEANQTKCAKHLKRANSIGNARVRSLPGQPAIPVFREFPSFDEKGPPNAGFSHRRLSLETDSRTFWAGNSQKSPAEFKKTPVFWRLASETEE